MRIGSLSHERFGHRKRCVAPVNDITFVVKIVLLGEKVGHLEMSLFQMSDGSIDRPDAWRLFEHGEFLHGSDGLLCCLGSGTRTFPFIFWIAVLEFIPGFSMRATTEAVSTFVEWATASRAV